MLTVLGVDPGLANQGVVVLSQATETSEINPRHVAVTVTKKMAGKRKRDLRVSADDQRRFKELFLGLEKVTPYNPHALCVEVYSPMPGRQGGSAWKTSATYGGVSYWALSRGMTVMPTLPQDIKRGIVGRLSASKKEVEVALMELIPNLASHLDDLKPPSLREHAVDAAAHAYLGLKELWEMRRMMGVK